MAGHPDGRAPDAEPTPPASVAHVVVALPVSRTFSYAIPERLRGQVQPGQRVRVPFQGRMRLGVVVELAAAAAAAGRDLHALEELVDTVPALTPPLLELARWGARETVSAWGQAVARAIPPPARVTSPGVLAPASPGGAPGPLVVVQGPGRAQLVEAAVARVRATGQGCLLLAPEIEIAHLWATRLEATLREPVALVTGAQTARRRWETWWALRAGRPRVAVGTRVAALLPVEALGLVAVVDEHDPAHKAPDAPRWHVRDLAIQRSRLEGASCVLASGAPSLETWVRVRAGEARSEAVKGDGWPEVHRVDLRSSGEDECLSPGLRDAMEAALTAGQATLLVLNRLGYARGLTCADCGATRRCGRCRVALTYHLDARTLVCRLCGFRRAAASLCGRCRGRRITPVGWGTERVEAEVRRRFPGVSVARYDGDVEPARAAAVRDAFRARQLSVVVGTHMVRRLAAEAPVGVAALVLADATLSLPDFRAGERTFQQAWHLAEGVVPGGSLWLQSFFPEHPALEAVALGTREEFYELEWRERQDLGYPPARRLARLVAEGRDAPRLAGELGDACRGAALAVLGPVTLSGSRVQLLVLGGAELPGVLGDVLAPRRGHRRLGSARLLVDVDPVDLL